MRVTCGWLVWLSACVAAFAQTAGTLDSSFSASVDATVQAVAALPDGRVIIAGDFTTCDGLPRTGLARLNADGTIDSTFAPTFKFPSDGGSLFALAVQPDGNLLVGGYFSDVNSSGRRTLVRLLENGIVDPTFNVDFAAESIVLAVALTPSGSIYAAGTFATIGKTDRYSVARLANDGSLDSTFSALQFTTGPFPTFTSAVVQPDGHLLLGGIFIASDGVRQYQNLIRLMPDGVTDGSFDPTLAVIGSSAIATVALDASGRIFVGGRFTASGHNDQAVRRLRTDGALDTTFAPSFQGQPPTPSPGTSLPTVNTLLVEPSGRIVVGGDFAGVNGAAQPYLTCLLVDGSRDERFMPGAAVDGEVTTLALSLDATGRLLVAGDFTHVGSAAAQRIARLLNPALPPRILQSPQSTTIGATANVALHLVIEAGGSDTIQWYRNGSPLTGETAPDLYLVNVTASGQYDAVVTNAAGTATTSTATVTVVPRVAGGLDASFAPDPVTENTPAGENVYHFLAVRPDGRALVEVGGFGDHTILQLNRDGHRDPNFRIIIANPTGSIGVIGLVALQADGGLLVKINTPTPVLRRYQADGTLDATFSFSLHQASLSELSTFGVQADGKILVAGRFIDGSDNIALVRTLPSGTLDSTFAPVTNALGGYPISWIQPLNDGSVLIGGFFSTVYGQSRPGIARLDSTGNLDASYHPGVGWNSGNLTGLPDGTLYASSPGSVVRLRADGTIDDTFVSAPMTGMAYGDRIFEYGAASQVYVQRDGAVILQGNFTRYGGKDVHPPIRLLSNGQIDPSFLMTATATLRGNAASFSVVGDSDDAILVAGQFDKIGDLGRPGLATIFRLGNGTAQLINLSSRGSVGRTGESLIAGFAVSGDVARPILIRAIGPTLANYSVPDALAEPQLALYAGTTRLQQNSGWAGDPAIAAANSRTGAFGLPTASRDAALLTPLSDGTYSAQISAPAKGSGIALAEVYLDDGDAGTRLVNLSTRGIASSGGDALIAGFTISGTADKQVLLRAVGPTLAAFQVGGAMADPKLTLVHRGVTVAENDNWSDDPNAGFAAAAARQTGGFPLPAGSRDAALLVRLSPGLYSMVIEPASGSSGVALAEVYDVTP